MYMLCPGLCLLMQEAGLCIFSDFMRKGIKKIFLVMNLCLCGSVNLENLSFSSKMLVN